MRAHFCLISAVLPIVLLPAPGEAQTDESNTAGTTLGDIVVTAQKRAQSIERVPASIQVVSGESITGYRKTSMTSIAADIPNLVLTASPSGAVQANIRGFGTSTGNSGFEQTVGLYVDGVYQPRPQSYTGSVFDVDHIEVVKGTQGTLFGKNASVGAISLITRAPGKEFGGFFDGSYEFRLDEARLEGAVDVPIGERIRTRFSGVYDRESKGWVENLATGSQLPTSREYGARAKVDFDATDTLTLHAKGEFNHYTRIGDAFLGTGGNVFSGISVGDAVGRIHSDLVTRDDGLPSNRRRSNVESFGFDWKVGDHTVTAITSWQKLHSNAFVDLDETDGPVDFVINFDEHFRQFTQELRIVSGDDKPFQYLAGVFYLNQRLVFDTNNFFAPSPAHQSLTVDAKAYSAFAQGVYKPSDTLTFTVGVRYTRDEKNGIFIAQKNAGTATTAREANDNSFDWSLVGEYEVATGTRVYASVSRGHKGQGFANSVPGAGLVPLTPVFDGEKATNYEIGLKSRFLGGRGRGNIAVYQLDVNGFQASQFDPAFASFIIQNIDARARGVEADVQFRVTPALQVNLSTAYNKAKIRGTGAQLVSAPRWNVTTGFDFTPELNSRAQLQIGSQFNYVSKYPHQFDLLPGNFTPGHINLNGRIGVKLKPSDVVIAIVGTNLTNERYADFAYGYSFDAPGAAFTQQLNRPRTIALNIHAPF